MGRLREVLRKQKLMREKGRIGGSFESLEMTYMADMILYQSQDELYITKSRLGNNGFIKLPDLIDIILKIYINSDLTEEFTPVAYFNEAIKKDLEEAMNSVLFKHGLRKE